MHDQQAQSRQSVTKPIAWEAGHTEHGTLFVLTSNKVSTNHTIVGMHTAQHAQSACIEQMTEPQSLSLPDILPGKLVILGMHGAQLVFTGGQSVAGLVAQLAHLLPQSISLSCSAPHFCL